MSYTPNKASIIYADYQASLTDGGEIDSGWLDMQGVDKVQFSGMASTAGMTMTLDSRADESQTALSTPVTYDDGQLYLFNVICRQRYMRFKWTNNTGNTVTNVSMEIKQTFGSSDKLSVFPVGVQPSDFSQAALVQSIGRGRSPQGTYEVVGVNQVGAVLTSDFGTEVARNLYEDYSIGTKFGRNPTVNTASTPEDMWNGGVVYTGFNADANEEITVSSNDADDVGTLVSSGTATGGSSTTLIDTGATFVTDGVAVGDVVLNDDHSTYGFITSVDSETQVTVFGMSHQSGVPQENASGENYRIANASDTGCAVLELSQILDEDFTAQPNVFVIMNGTSDVTTSGVNAMRCTRARCLLAGTSGLNEGEITITQAATTANVFAVMPTTGQTTIGVYTVPAGKTMLMKRIRASITRANGSSGSATVVLFSRDPKGGAWNGFRVFELQTGAPTEFTLEGAGVFYQGTDIKFTITDVSDNGTISEGAFEYYLVDND